MTIDDAALGRRLPPTNATLSASVGTLVEIIRDRAGIPHIYAGSTGDLYPGLGFAMAQDRLWQNSGQPALAASSGAEYHQVVDFAEPERFPAVQNVGNFGQPGGPLYTDQFEARLAGSYHVVSLRRADVERDGEGKIRLEPRG
ncbi:MAG: penicillin acylase family protein [Chloroflexi bacterium]|nr:penicillin acylase family protein [Chloroflexota bacterium]